MKNLFNQVLKLAIECNLKRLFQINMVLLSILLIFYTFLNLDLGKVMLKNKENKLLKNQMLIRLQIRDNKLLQPN